MPSDAEALCLACGLCCDGTLFTAVPLEPAEVVPLSPTVTPSGGRKLEQPCAALSGCACTVYAQRPRVCRHYRCLLLEALQADEVSLADARATLETLHGQLRALAGLLPPPQAPTRGSALLRARQVVQRGAGAALATALWDVEEALRFHLTGHQRR